jgi:hypothetical protein
VGDLASAGGGRLLAEGTDQALAVIREQAELSRGAL